MKKCVIIYNEKSGKVKSDNIINNFHRIVEEYGYKLDVYITERVGHGTEIIKELPNDIDLVIAAGGDGTLSEVIKGNIERKHKLLMSILPMGTTNDVGSMYGFSKNYEKALESILNGVEKNIDIVMMNNTPFIYVAAFGNFINVTFDTPKKLKETFGRFGYILHGFSNITEKIQKHHIKYKIDGEEKEGEYSFIFITNGNHIAGVNEVYKDIKLDDNKFEVVLCDITNKAELLMALMHIYIYGVEKMNGCKVYSTSNMEIEFDDVPAFSWGLDGEEYKPDTNKFKFTINKDINLLLPTDNIDKLFVNKEK
ncbi:MAG: YegS/Rv2252/BmrU family lipid kinase [Bacilli bacterium]|nr:YegS/Rv2252/BmrU family lipid kinase [Bacilli bacterium]